MRFSSPRCWLWVLVLAVTISNGIAMNTWFCPSDDEGDMPDVSSDYVLPYIDRSFQGYACRQTASLRMLAAMQMILFLVANHRSRFTLLLENCKRVQRLGFATLFSGSDFCFEAFKSIIQCVLGVAYKPVLASEPAVEMVPWKLLFCLRQSNSRMACFKVSEVANSHIVGNQRSIYRTKRLGRLDGKKKGVGLLVAPSEHVGYAHWVLAGWPCKNHTGKNYLQASHKDAISTGKGTSGQGFRGFIDYVCTHKPVMISGENVHI